MNRTLVNNLASQRLEVEKEGSVHVSELFVRSVPYASVLHIYQSCSN